MIDNLHISARKSKKSPVVTALLFLSCLTISLCFSSKSSAKQSPQVKTQTIVALQAIDQGRWDIGRDLIAKTRDPLASKLYYWLVFTRKSEDHRFGQLTQFIRNNPEWPSIRALQLKAEKVVPDSLSASEVTAWFDDFTPTREDSMDRYLNALIIQGKSKQAKDILADWWATAKLEREGQKNIYRKYGGLLDTEAHHRRFDMLLFSGKYNNARAIARVLERGYPELAEARIALAQERDSVGTLISKIPHALQNDTGLLYERLRWRRRKDLDVGAMQILNNMPPASMIENKAAWWRERHIMIRRMIEQKKYKTAYVLARGHIQQDGFSFAQAEWLSGWLALRFLKNEKLALQHFEHLHSKVSTPVSLARAAYWAGRAAEDMYSAEALYQWYEKASKFQTTYYGQLAGKKLGVDHRLPNAAPPNVTPEDVQMFENHEFMQVARLLHAAGMRKDASRFIHAFTAQENTPKAYRYAAEEAARMKRYHDALRISKKATKQGMFLTAQAYPVMRDKLSNISVDHALVHAIVRQESLFDEKAKSPVGALGLMQLMPTTAQETARKLGIRYKKSWLTEQPQYNVRLGSKYLGDMLERFNGSYPMAIAAYNAGPGRVEKWIEVYGDPRLGQVDYLDWIEMIPIYETRNYVQRVIENAYIYRLRLKNI